MDITRMLEADHRMVEGLFAQIREKSGDERSALVDTLVESLQAHIELEETVVYPEMKPVTGEEVVTEGITEHDLARKAMADVIALAPEEPGFEAALDALEAGVQHHVEDEEEKVFPQLRQEAPDVIESMASAFQAKRRELGMKIDPEALAEGATKEQLVEEANGLDIDGTSSMNKAELAEALAAAG